MKKWISVLAATLSVFVLVAYVSAQDEDVPPTIAAAKPEKGILIGHVIELSTYAMKGFGEEDHVTTMRSRAKQGFPLAIRELDTGKIYIVTYRSSAPASHLEVANRILEPLVGMKVTAMGLKYHADGINVVRLSTVSEY